MVMITTKSVDFETEVVTDDENQSIRRAIDVCLLISFLISKQTNY